MLGSRPFQHAYATDAVTTSFTAQVATGTRPSGDGVIDLKSPDDGPVDGNYVADWLHLKPFGIGAADDDYHMQVWGWSYNSTDDQWEPYFLLEVAVTLGNIAGSKGTNSFDADTITFRKGDVDAKIISPGNDLVASITLDPMGSELVSILFDKDIGTEPTSCNCLYRLVAAP